MRVKRSILAVTCALFTWHAYAAGAQSSDSLAASTSGSQAITEKPSASPSPSSTPKPTSEATPKPTSGSSFESFIEFRSTDGQLLANGKPFFIKGINWFGFETIENVVQGLWPHATTIPKALDVLKREGFNAVRLPLALDTILADWEVPADQTAGMPNLEGKTYLEVLDAFVGYCRQRNMLVVFDNHRIEASEPDFPDVADPEKITPALVKLAKRYCHSPSAWNVIGVDLKTQPKGKATWGMGKDTDWNVAAAEIGNAVLDECDRWLIFVQGVQNNIKGVRLSWGQAGGSLQGAKKMPVKLSNMERLVYSPNVVSPGRDDRSPWWYADDFPSNMEGIWDESFGSVPEATERAVVVAAWGARMEGKDQVWATELSSYLTQNTIGSFYWAFNPQSADMGGLMKDDWKTAHEDRLRLLENLPSSNVDDVMAKFSACTGKCRGYGDCINGQCQCYSGWSGPQCDICTPGDREACGNDGICLDDSTCQCEGGAEGKYCRGWECEDIDCGSSDNAACSNGECVCQFHCVGSNCKRCTTDAKLVSTDLVLCDSCPSLVKDAASTTSASIGVFVLSFIWCIFLSTA